MRIIFVADRSFTSREQSLLGRIEVGLLDEGVEVIRVLPASLSNRDDGQLSRILTFPDVGPRLMRPFRIAQMLERLEPLSGEPGRPPAFDIVHAWGEGCWALARELAGVTGAQLLLEVWSQRSLERIRSFERSAADLQTMGQSVAWSAADEAIAARARALALWRVFTHPWGVHLPPAPRKQTGDDEPTPIVVLPEGHDAGATIALLRGLARAMKDLKGEPPLILLGEAAVRASRSVWRAVESLNLAENTTVLADAESRREPVLLAEVLALPEAGGEHRSIPLEAMAAGQTVMALADPLVDAYRDNHTCHIVPAPTPHCWGEAFAAILPDPARRRRIGLGARAWVEHNRRVHPHVSALMVTYKSLVERARKLATG